MVHLSLLTNQYWYINKIPCFLLIFLVFPECPFSVSESHLGYHIKFHNIISRVCTVNMISSVDVDLNHPAEVVFVSFCQWKLFFLPLSVLYLLKDITIYRKNLRNGKLYFTSLMGKYLHNLFVILLHGRYFCSPHLFIYSVT